MTPFNPRRFIFPSLSILGLASLSLVLSAGIMKGKAPCTDYLHEAVLGSQVAYNQKGSLGAHSGKPCTKYPSRQRSRTLYQATNFQVSSVP